MSTRVEADKMVMQLQLLKRRKVPHPRVQRVLDGEASDRASPLQGCTERRGTTIDLVSTVNPGLVLCWQVIGTPQGCFNDLRLRTTTYPPGSTGGAAWRRDMHPDDTPTLKNPLYKGPGAGFTQVKLDYMSKGAMLIASPVNRHYGVSSPASCGR